LHRERELAKVRAEMKLVQQAGFEPAAPEGFLDRDDEFFVGMDNDNTHPQQEGHQPPRRNNAQVQGSEYDQYYYYTNK